MTAKAKKFAGPIGVVAALLVILAIWHMAHRPTNPLITDPKSTQNVMDFDQFQQDLAARVLREFGAGDDFSVVVATTAYPLGTLLRATGSVPADFDDCVPPTLPRPLSAQRMFPSYTLSSDTALAASLGSHATKGLESAGLNLGQSRKVQYTIADTQVQIMDDKSVELVTGQGNCGRYIASHPGMRLIRGAVMGKISFTVKVDNPATVKAQLAKIGGFSITDNPQSSTLGIADEQSEPFVQLLSEFRSAPTTSTSAMPKPVEAVSLTAQPPAAAADTRAHMFVQMDSQDSPASGAKVVELLRTSWPSATVESKVESIPTRKMPDTAQVRYFDASDAVRANKCAAILKQDYPDTRVVRIGLPSPKGQLEVWLPKVKSGATGK